MRCLIRGGNWNNGANAGVFNSNLNNPRSNSNGNIGGRSAFRLTVRRDCAGSGLSPTGYSTVYRLKGVSFHSAEKYAEKLQTAVKTETPHTAPD